MSVVSQPKLLRDVVVLEKGKPPAQQPYFGTDAELYLTPEYLRGNAVAEQVKPSINAVRVNEGETIVLWDGSNAGEIFRSRRGILASTMSRVRHSDAYDEEYFFHALKGWEEYLKSQTSGSGIPHVDKEILGRLELIEFSKPEQTKIAAVLSTVDRAIEQTEALIAKQQRIKTGLMQDLLTRGIDEHGNLRSEETHEFKDSPLGRIPVEWEVRTVAELSTKVTDGDHHTPERSEAGFYLLSARNVNDGFIDLADVDYVPLSEYRRMLRRCNPEAGDILVSCSGTIGRVCEVPGWLQCVLVRSAALVKFKRARITSRFAEWAMRSSGVQLQIFSAQRQAAQPNLFQGEIANLRLPEPPIEEQENIAEILDSSEAEMNHGRKTLIKLRFLKTALMQDLLTGEKRVTPLLEADDEQAAGSAL
jgi:type I restriction enzyme S subunit